MDRRRSPGAEPRGLSFGNGGCDVARVREEAVAEGGMPGTVVVAYKEASMHGEGKAGATGSEIH